MDVCWWFGFQLGNEIIEEKKDNGKGKYGKYILSLDLCIVVKWGDSLCQRVDKARRSVDIFLPVHIHIVIPPLFSFLPEIW